MAAPRMGEHAKKAGLSGACLDEASQWDHNGQWFETVTQVQAAAAVAEVASAASSQLPGAASLAPSPPSATGTAAPQLPITTRIARSPLDVELAAALQLPSATRVATSAPETVGEAAMQLSVLPRIVSPPPGAASGRGVAEGGGNDGLEAEQSAQSFDSDEGFGSPIRKRQGAYWNTWACGMCGSW